VAQLFEGLWTYNSLSVRRPESIMWVWVWAWVCMCMSQIWIEEERAYLQGGWNERNYKEGL